VAGDITKFDADYNKSLQVENSVSGGPLNLKGNPLNNNALYTEATVSETPPDDLSKNNPSYLISKNAAGEAVYVDTIISGTTYRQTLTRSDIVITQTLAISANVEL